MKPSNGAGGFGFVDLRMEEGCIFWNMEKITMAELQKRQKELHSYIVTEFILQHPKLNAVWSKSMHTLRVLAVRNRIDSYVGEVKVVASYVRFGTEASGTASNLDAGGCSF